MSEELGLFSSNNDCISRIDQELLRLSSELLKDLTDVGRQELNVSINNIFELRAEIIKDNKCGYDCQYVNTCKIDIEMLLAIC